MQKITKNVFNKGLNLDLDPDILQSDSYLSAKNLSLVNEGKFLALQNLKGTSVISTIASSSTTKVLGLFLNKYSINGFKDVAAFTEFIYDTVSGEFKIVLIGKDTAGTWGTGDTLTLYSETLDTVEYNKVDPYIDGVSYSENGVDTLYFTDGYNEIRKLKCLIEDTSSFTTLTNASLSLTRRFTTAKFTSISSGTNGSLLCGSYQYALRLINNDTKTYSKFTLLSTPIHCYNTDLYKTTAGIGQSSGKSIELQIEIDLDEVEEYTHYQIAVIENIGATENSALEASLLTPQTITSPSTAYSFSHDSNSRFETISLDELVIDKAAIKSVKTLQIKNNRLFGANVKYYDLAYDNGDPSIYSGSIIYKLLDPDTVNTSVYVGHFRDEVYRYAISYFDEFYNFSRPKVLDMSTVTNNKKSSGIDMKFPKRSDGNQWALLDSGDRVRNLGLSLTVTNHPTWAKGFVILRAKRKKNILFQTPFVPTAYIAGMQADITYPSTFIDIPSWDTGDSTSSFSYPASEATIVESAQPMNPLGTLMPKNLFKPLSLDTKYKRLEGIDESHYYRMIGDAIVGLFTTKLPSYYKVVFPPSSILDFSDNLTNSNRAFKFKGNEGYELVDVAHLKLKYDARPDPNETDFVDGYYIRTNVDGTFYAISNKDYHYDAAYISGKDFSELTETPTTGKLIDYEFVDVFGEGVSVGGTWFGKYDNLVTKGAEWGTKADNMKLAVVKLNQAHIDSTYYSMFPYSYSCAGGYISSSLIQSLNGSFTDSGFVYEYPTYTDSSYVNTIEIVNVTDNLSDNRYGTVDTPHEFISTGAYYVFDDTELASIESGVTLNTTVSVWGGDCYIGLCNYKITNGHYSIAGKHSEWSDTSAQEKIQQWDRIYANDYDDVIYKIPVGLEGVGTTISVFIESEFPPNVQDSNEYTKDSLLSKDISYSGSYTNSRTPFSYLYNINLSKENDQKIFIPFQEFEKKVNTFQSRIVFSNQKIYQSDLEGFDQFNALDFYDLNETYGKIIKLPKAANNVYAIQTDGIAYVPIQANVLETADGATLNVASGDIISTPQYISNTYGAQHQSLVTSTSEAFYLADTKRKAILRVSNGIENISELGFIKASLELNSNVKSYDYSCIYDANRKELLIVNNGIIYVFNERLGQWISTIEPQISTVLNGHGIKDGLFLSALDSNNNLQLGQLYTGTPNNLFEEVLQPSATFIVNPDIEVPKTFDNLVVYSDDKLDSFDMVVRNELGQVDFESNGIDLDIDRREGAYRAKVLRDANGARLRGRRAEITAFWPLTGQVALSSIITKYRISDRRL